MQRATLLALVGEVERDALLQGLEELVQGVAGSEATGQLGHIGPIAAVLHMDAGG